MMHAHNAAIEEGVRGEDIQTVMHTHSPAIDGGMTWRGLECKKSEGRRMKGAQEQCR